MTDKVIKNLYRSYKQKCADNDLQYVSIKKFKKVHNKAKKLLLEAEEKNKNNNKIPLSAIPIDDNWIYWVEIRDNNAVVNIVTHKQFNLLFQKELNNKEVKDVS